LLHSWLYVNRGQRTGRADHFEVSGAECVIALSALGFVVVRRNPGQTILRRKGQFVLVPDYLRLPRPILTQIVTDAGLDYASLFATMDELPTETDLPILDAVP
jgi:hypothetical protein